MRLPRRLGRNPLIDCTAEVRFSALVPNDAVLGLVYTAIQPKFGKPTNLPILQLPAQMRENDPNLKYQPCYRFESGENVLQVGPHTVALSNSAYQDWGTMSVLLQSMLQKLETAGLFDRIERLGLRYINFFEDLNILDKSTLTLEVRGSSISSQSVNIRSEANEGSFTVITQITNKASARRDGGERKGSIIDIDIVKEPLSLALQPLTGHLMKVFVDANAVADLAFFRLLQDDFISTFDPEY